MNNLKSSTRALPIDVLDELDHAVIEPNDEIDELDLEDRFNFERGNGNGAIAYC